MSKSEKPELITREELKQLAQIAAKSVAYEDSFGIEGCDLTMDIWSASYIRQSLEEFFMETISDSNDQPAELDTRKGGPP